MQYKNALLFFKPSKPNMASPSTGVFFISNITITLADIRVFKNFLSNNPNKRQVNCVSIVFNRIAKEINTEELHLIAHYLEEWFINEEAKKKILEYLEKLDKSFSLPK
jgi:hypothetical protein